jgi:hypothetical protein
VTDQVIVEEPDVRSKGGKGRRKHVTVDAQGGTVIRRPVGYTRRSAELASRVGQHERRARAYTLRVGGFSCLDIGYFLHADPALNTDPKSIDPETGEKVGLHGGYGWQNYRDGKPALRDDALRVSVSRDLTKGIEAAAKYEALNREEYVQVEVASLNAAQAAMWPKVLRGDTVAVERFVKLSERRSKLLGLDAPVQVESKAEVSITVEGRQPDYNPQFAGVMFGALVELGALDAMPVIDTTAVPALEAAEAPAPPT